MKKLTLLCMSFQTLLIYANENKRYHQQNTELIGSWQYKTDYYTDKETCYTGTENYYFYSDFSYVKMKSMECIDSSISAIMHSTQHWRIYNNNLVLLDEQGKQQAIYNAKDANSLIKGQKVISQIKYIESEPFNSNKLIYSSK